MRPLVCIEGIIVRSDLKCMKMFCKRDWFFHPFESQLKSYTWLFQRYVWNGKIWLLGIVTQVRKNLPVFDMIRGLGRRTWEASWKPVQHALRLFLVQSQITNSSVEFFCPDTGLNEGILNLEISFQLLAGRVVVEEFL